MGFTSDQAIANMMASFARIWGDSWGPRLAYVVKHVLKTLYTVNEVLVAQGKADEQYTLLDVNPLLQQTKYAKKVLGLLDKNNLQHQKELSWWNDYYFKLPPSFQQEVISPVSNKIGIFADNHTLERIVGQPKTTIDVSSSITDGKIILVNLASGRLEFDAAAIIGATILNLVHRMLQLQAHIPFPERRQVFIAVDEFQNIPGADYEALLSEDRKYGGSLMLATQSLVRLEQMKEGLEAITFSNCAQLFVFATSAEDAEKLEKELHEQVTIAHMLNQPRLNCFAKLTLPDQPLQIFSMQLAKPEGWKRSPENEARAEAIRTWNQERHLPRTEVDTLLEAHTKRYLNVESEANKAEAKKAAPPTNPPKQQGKGNHEAKPGGAPPAQRGPSQSSQPSQPAHSPNQSGKQAPSAAANQSGQQPEKGQAARPNPPQPSQPASNLDQGHKKSSPATQQPERPKQPGADQTGKSEPLQKLEANKGEQQTLDAVLPPPDVATPPQEEEQPDLLPLVPPQPPAPPVDCNSQAATEEPPVQVTLPQSEGEPEAFADSNPPEASSSQPVSQLASEPAVEIQSANASPAHLAKEDSLPHERDEDREDDDAEGEEEMPVQASAPAQGEQPRKKRRKRKRKKAPTEASSPPAEVPALQSITV